MLTHDSIVLLIGVEYTFDKKRLRIFMGGTSIWITLEIDEGRQGQRSLSRFAKQDFE